ncbi:MAG TPA: ribonuclease H-like domain-containing protein [Acidobacteriota bacterium]|nr:ribonuclease H-like domain-containing protein [Acidobacteriota bacterium]
MQKSSRRAGRGRLAEFLGGSWSPQETLAVRRELPVSARHGRTLLSDFLKLRDDDFFRLTGDRSFSRIDPQEFLFLDTETTGLSGGAGTVVFLTGAAYFVADRLVLQQFFLPSFDAEAGFLESLNGLVQRAAGRFRFLVTFNGKSYDVQVLDTRFLLKRLSNPFRRMPHLDLLHPGRALWKGRFQDCSLQTLERSVLRFSRRDDFPSHLIPQAYFNYLRTGSYQPLGPILEHNRNDLISLISLTQVMAEAVCRPRPGHLTTPLAAARLLENRRCFTEAEQLLEGALAGDEWGACKQDCMELLARLKKRRGSHREALSLLQRLLEDAPRPSLEAFEEAAKLLEHRTGDLKRAQRITRLALQHYPASEPLHHRLHRLDCRLQGRRWWGG